MRRTAIARPVPTPTAAPPPPRQGAPAPEGSPPHPVLSGFWDRPRGGTRTAARSQGLRPPPAVLDAGRGPGLPPRVAPPGQWRRSARRAPPSAARKPPTFPARRARGLASLARGSRSNTHPAAPKFLCFPKGGSKQNKNPPPQNSIFSSFAQKQIQITLQGHWGRITRAGSWGAGSHGD